MRATHWQFEVGVGSGHRSEETIQHRATMQNHAKRCDKVDKKMVREAGIGFLECFIALHSSQAVKPATSPRKTGTEALGSVNTVCALASIDETTGGWLGSA